MTEFQRLCNLKSDYNSGKLAEQETFYQEFIKMFENQIRSGNTSVELIPKYRVLTTRLKTEGFIVSEPSFRDWEVWVSLP